MYSPKIKEDHVRRLYKLKQSKPEKRPLTYYVNEALEQYLKYMEKNPVMDSVKKEGDGKAE